MNNALNNFQGEEYFHSPKRNEIKIFCFKLLYVNIILGNIYFVGVQMAFIDMEIRIYILGLREHLLNV